MSDRMSIGGHRPNVGGAAQTQSPAQTGTTPPTVGHQGTTTVTGTAPQVSLPQPPPGQADGSAVNLRLRSTTPTHSPPPMERAEADEVPHYNNMTDDDTIHYNNVSEGEKIQYNNVSQEEKIHYNNVSDGEKIQYNNVSEDDKIHYNNVSEDDKIHYNNVDPDDKIHYNNVGEDDKIHYNNMSDDEKNASSSQDSAPAEAKVKKQVRFELPPGADPMKGLDK